MSSWNPEECAARGAALLDEKVPGWRESVNLASLEMADVCSCVLGQACRGMFYGSALDLVGAPERGRLAFEVRFGFSIPDSRGTATQSWDPLELAWRKLLAGKDVAHAG